MSSVGRLLLVLLVSASLAVTGWRAGAGSLDAPRPAPAAGHPASPPPRTAPPPRARDDRDAVRAEQTRALRVLRGWDLRRARAYARGDATALRRLYVPGSRAGEADVRLLEAYAGRGLVVRGLTMQLLAVRARARCPDSLRLRVTARVSGARAAPLLRPGPETLLPRDAPSTHVMTLHRRGGRWQVGWVRSPGSG